MVRQQIGHYLYIIDRGRREIVIMNSNRMTVIDRIPTQDPTTFAMSPNLNLLAVVNQTANLVSFIDIDPLSSTFHQIVQETIVGERPRGIAWDPGNEDILVANETENSVSVISAAALQVRKVVRSQLNQPFDVAITPRQLGWGFVRNVYFAYILNRSGRVAIFESGPNTVNGWGYDDVIGIAPGTFRNPKAIQPDHVDLRSGVWIAHEGPINIATDEPGALGVPAVSKLVIESGLVGALPLNFTSLLIPQFRDLFLGVQISIGPPQLSGIPVDLAFDDLRNLTGMPNVISFFSAGASVPINGKGLVRVLPNGVFINNNEPRFLFVAVPSPTIGTGVVDVVRIDQGFVRIDTDPFQAGIQSIQAPNCQVVADYFRQ
jgi:YVTN family beta-propeller protein